ncbi:MAG: AAA family ATPase [Leptolinea sp.]
MGNKNGFASFAAILNNLITDPKTKAAYDAAISEMPYDEQKVINQALFTLQPGVTLTGSPPVVHSWANISSLLGPIQWDWDGWLARGFLTLLAAESGTGKSALALTIASIYLKGASFPDGQGVPGERGKVVWCEAESAQVLNTERASKWGLPMDNIITPLLDPLEDVSLDNPEHCAMIEKAAFNPEVKLIIVDSLSGATGGDEKESKMLEPCKVLARIARDSQKPVLLLHHLRKKNQIDGDEISLARVRGHGNIVQLARCIWAIDRPDIDQPDWMRLSVIKSNLGKFPKSLGFRIGDQGITFGIAPEKQLVETQESKAIDLLKVWLSECAKPSKWLEEEFNAAGISWRTVKRSKDKLGVITFKKDNVWFWGLPAK